MSTATTPTIATIDDPKEINMSTATTPTIATIDDLIARNDVRDVAEWIKNVGGFNNDEVDHLAAKEAASRVLDRVKKEASKRDSFSIFFVFAVKSKNSRNLIPFIADAVLNRDNFLTSLSFRKADVDTVFSI